MAHYYRLHLIDMNDEEKSAERVRLTSLGESDYCIFHVTAFNVSTVLHLTEPIDCFVDIEYVL